MPTQTKDKQDTVSRKSTPLVRGLELVNPQIVGEGRWACPMGHNLCYVTCEHNQHGSGHYIHNQYAQLNAHDCCDL